MTTCINHEITIILEGNGVETSIISITNYCNKCGRTFSKEMLRRIIKQWDSGFQ